MKQSGSLLVALAIATSAGAARADGPGAAPPGNIDVKNARAAGQQVENGPRPVERPPLAGDPEGRKAIRGCPVDRDCIAGADDDGLREFEAITFPRPGESPWVDADDSALRGIGTRGAAVLGERPAARTVAKPSELRPDLAWLDGLEMPDLPVRWDARVIAYLEFYKSDPRGHAIMESWLRAQGRYRDLMTAALRRARLPEDLLYVSMIESSYDPHDRSHAGASGLWQFMPDGGRIYGLDIDRWVDERDDPVRSTEAVLQYFADLYQRFGDWDLALAAYNAGYGAVIKAIAKYNTNDFWQLLEYENALPWESSIYVPKALAAAIVGRNPERFGFGALKALPAEAWDEVAVPASVPLAAIARAVGCSTEVVQRLNPQLRRNRTPPGLPSFVVRVPAGGGRRFAERFPGMKSEWDGFDTYVVSYGERFEDIATMHGISRARLRELNDVGHESEIGGGMLLVVPRLSAAEKAANLEKARESLYASGVDGKKGEPLIVAVPDKDAEVAGARRVFYRVVTGDSQHKIARAFGVTPARLAGWNGLDGEAQLHPRMVLQLFVAPTFDAAKAKVALLDETRILVVTRGSKEHLDLSEQRIGRERFTYVAKKKESFESIGKKYGLTARDLARINRRSYETVLAAGEEIVVYRVVDRGGSERATEQARKAPKAARARGGGKAEEEAETPEPAGRRVAAEAPGDEAEADEETRVTGEPDEPVRMPEADEPQGEPETKKGDAKGEATKPDAKGESGKGGAKKTGSAN